MNNKSSITAALRFLIVLVLSLSSVFPKTTLSASAQDPQAKLPASAQLTTYASTPPPENSAIDLILSTNASSPYCLNGCLSLDPRWVSNRIRPNELPREPVDFVNALGVSPSTPDLATLYVPNSELLLTGGPKISYKANDTLHVSYCLNNPGQVVSEQDECRNYVELSPGFDDNDRVLAVEKDVYGNQDKLNAVLVNLSESRFGMFQRL